MDADWVNSPAARRILVHWADPRPAWLWAADGSLLLWRNGAARLFNARLKKSGLKLAPDPVPIRGQLARLVRLGAPGRSSLSRIQFLAGDKPVSTTCSVTPLEAPDGRQAVLLVAVDPIEPELLALAPDEAEPQAAALLPGGLAYLLVDPQGQVSAGSRQAAELVPLIDADATRLDYDGNSIAITRLTASPQGHRLLLLEGLPRPIDTIRAEEGIAPEPAHAVVAEPEQPHLPMALPETTPAPAASESAPEATPPTGETLSSLFDRLVDNDALYGELTAEDDVFVAPAAPVESEEAAPAAPQPAAPEAPTPPAEPDMIAAVIEFEDDIGDELPTTYRVTGRGFTPLAAQAVAIIDTGPEAEEAPPRTTPAATASESESESGTESADLPVPPVNAGAVERLSRYNFDELSRILTDRVGTEPPTRPAAPSADDTATAPLRAVPAAALNEGALINIAAETFVLNRLPLGILVFRDQQVLFANRALTDLVGYETIDSLRGAGIAAIFPGDDAGSAGPVTQLVRRDGSRIPVTARLQSITWQGRPALMLSASAAEPRLGGEAAVRGFAQTLAAAREDGFLGTDRAGIVTQVSDAGLAALARSASDLLGTPLVAAILDTDAAALRAFLERPARFAETVRPSILLRSTTPGVDILLFAEGQAGIVSGYFGFVTQREAAVPSPAAAALAADEDDADPAMLVRISRGVRRPLNTIIGFADLIRSASFGTADAHRAVEYARDIKTAGQEIAVLVDELDDYSRLKTGKYAARPAELDLAALLDSCVVRVRGHAGAARVLVRSAISERLPKIRADRASLGQAILNLLASAIDQTPAGAQVILSAQPDAYGGVAVNVRDSGLVTADPGERFVVFRDGVGKDGETLAPVRSSVGLALTRSLLAVNACTLSVDPAGAVGTLFSITVPADLVAAAS